MCRSRFGPSRSHSRLVEVIFSRGLQYANRVVMTRTATWALLVTSGCAVSPPQVLSDRPEQPSALPLPLACNVATLPFEAQGHRDLCCSQLGIGCPDLSARALPVTGRACVEVQRDQRACSTACYVEYRRPTSTASRCKLVVDVCRRSDRASIAVRRRSTLVVVVVGSAPDVTSIHLSHRLKTSGSRGERQKRNANKNDDHCGRGGPGMPWFVSSRHADSTDFRPTLCNATHFRTDWGPTHPPSRDCIHSQHHVVLGLGPPQEAKSAQMSTKSL